VSAWAPGNYDGATYEYDAFENIRRNVLGQSNASSGRDIRYEYDTSTNRLGGLGFSDGTTAAQYQGSPASKVHKLFTTTPDHNERHKHHEALVSSPTCSRWGQDRSARGLILEPVDTVLADL
jgi:hypothetical protein